MEKKAKLERATLVASVLLLAFVFSGCATTDTAKPPESAAIPSASNLDVTPTRALVRDWSSREGARVQAGLLFAAKTANELKQYVVTGTGSVLDDGQLDIVEEIATATKVTIAGNSPVADFWQLVEIEDTATHQKTQEYLYYIVYSMDESTRKVLVRKYTNDIIGRLPDRAMQTKVANAFADIDATAARETAMTTAQFKAQIAAQEQKTKNDQQIALAQVNQQTAANNQAALTARAELEANAGAQRAALKSGDPARVAAASATSGDINWISALSTAASVLF